MIAVICFMFDFGYIVMQPLSAVLDRDDDAGASLDIPQAKRQRVEDAGLGAHSDKRPEAPLPDVEADAQVFTQNESQKAEALVPPSRALLGDIQRQLDEPSSTSWHTQEIDVGISEYVSKDLPPIHAIIKQRYAPSCLLLSAF